MNRQSKEITIMSNPAPPQLAQQGLPTNSLQYLMLELIQRPDDKSLRNQLLARTGLENDGLNALLNTMC